MLICPEAFGSAIATPPVNSSAVTFGIVSLADGKSAGSVNSLPYGSTYFTSALDSASSVSVTLNVNPPL